MLDYEAVLRPRYPATQGDFPACFAFSIHKAGSTMMYKMINDVCRLAGVPAFSIPDALFLEGVSDDQWRHDTAIASDWVREGIVYYGFRYLPELLLEPSVRLRERRSVLLVRDPRDALVSQYYSYGGRHVSHRLPAKNSEKFLEKAARTSHLDIDEYVLGAARGYLRKLQAYRENLDFSQVLLCRYEDVYYDKRSFIGRIFMHFGISVPAAALDAVATRHDVRPAAEDPGKHIRKGEPGDHREKLNPHTIVKLDALFAGICAGYGYQLGPEAVP